MEQKHSAHDDVLIAVIANDISYIKATLENITKQYVTKTEFEPVKRIVYGMVSLVLVGVLGAVIALVLNTKR